MDHVTLTLHAEPLEPCADMRSDSVFLYVKSCLGLEEFNGSIVNMQIYPNPVHGEMHLQAMFWEDLDVIVQVINNSGKAIFKGVYPTINKKINKVFDFSHLPDGVYFIRLKAGEETAVRKVILSK
jgi:hypothetical protein